MTSLRDSINEELKTFTRIQQVALEGIGAELAPVARAMEQFIVDGGKRLRPIFAYLGYLGSGGKPRSEIVKAVTSLELVHVCALIHDDVMDGSDLRRNRPAIHRQFEKLHRDHSYHGEPSKFGIAAAILLGDLALVWSDRVLRDSGITESELHRALPVFNEMRDELMAGQYLDVLEGALASSSVARSLKVARFKSGKYSIERPLHFGGALVGASVDILNSYSSFGLPLGEAFQLRDDILGVFGDPGLTGKPAGDDLREGKRTVLIAMAYEGATNSQTQELNRGLGASDVDVEKLREIIVNTGALARCEEMIESLRNDALTSLHSSAINLEIRRTLEEMALIATERVK